MTYIDTVLVQWYSKELSLVKTSVFGVKNVAIKQGLGALRSLFPVLALHIYMVEISL